MYKTAIIGCGKISSDLDPGRGYIVTHAGAYTYLDRTKLVALCDINEDKLKKTGEKWGISNLYKNYKEMFDKEDIDILSICTWNSTHHEIVEYATNFKVRAILCEKPIATTLKEADNMINLCNKNNILLSVNHQRRFDKFHRKIKDYIDQGNLGEIQQASFYYSSGVANFGSHMFDLLRYFFQEPDFIQGYYKNNLDDPNIDGLLKFKGGLITTIQSFDKEKHSIFDLYIYGTKGAIKITNFGLGIEMYNIKNSKLLPGYKELSRTKSNITRNKKDSPIVHGIENIIKTLENKSKLLSAGEDGREALALICAFHESAIDNGRQIKLPLKTSNIKIK